MNKTKSILASLFLLISFNLSAAPIAIDTMFVDNVAADLTLGTGIFSETFSASTGISPPAEIMMGEFQNSILDVNSSGFDLNIYSTGLNGSPAPTGTVDGTIIDVDFSSLRGVLTYSGLTYDFELWPLTTTLDYGVYDPGNGDFSIGWTDNFTIDLASVLLTPASLDVNLQGYLTTVPVPAAVWLFGSGIITMFGFSYRRREQK